MNPYSGAPPMPVYTGVYATDLEHHQSFQGAYCDPAFGYNQPVFSQHFEGPSDYNTFNQSNGYHQGEYYSDQYLYDANTANPMLTHSYSEHVPQQQPQFDFQGSANVLSNGTDRPVSYQSDHQTGQNSRGRGRGRGGAGNFKRGGKKQNYDNHSNWYDDKRSYPNQYPDPPFRGNFRGNRGNKAMNFPKRNAGKYEDVRSDSRNGYDYDSGNGYYNQYHHKQERSQNEERSKYRQKDSKHDFMDKENNLNIMQKSSAKESSSAASSRASDPYNELSKSKGKKQERSYPSKADTRTKNSTYDDDNVHLESPKTARCKQKQYDAKKFSMDSEKSSYQNKKYDYKGARPKQWNKSEPQDVRISKDESQRGALTEQLSKNAYECMVCYEVIKVESSVWSCQNCYHVFHLHCTKKWAHSSVDKDTKSWRCPGCQNETQHIPSQYKCFCGRRKDPAYVRGETPHSCGETCRKKRKENCVHPCTILCHPGPCPPCSSMVNQSCDCGKQRKGMRCSVASPFKCEAVCEKMLSCGEHKCEEICHPGACESCIVSKPQGCYCGKKQRDVICGTAEFNTVSYTCEENCGRTLSCGNHVCEVMCHPGDCAPCSLDPNILTSCCCGQTSRDILDAAPRYSCLDPIPTCDQICNKPMLCGPENDHHRCTKICHEGSCGPCDKETLVFCHCGRMDKEFACEAAIAFNDKNPFKCQKRCGKKKTCGRHKCSDNCCVKDYHLCEYICGLKLNCGVHKCKEMCHRGNCKRCLETSFDDLSCYCGMTTMEPPIPCGTKPPECRQLCNRPQPCNHTVRHFCHMEDDCAPCTELTEKTCMGGHTVRKNIPCHMKNISCGMPCDKQLPCGNHRCLKTCHKGPCLDVDATCTQPCTKPRVACGHPCAAPCHKADCPSTFCKTKITIVCRCGNRTVKMECQMGGDQSTEIAQFQRLSVQSIADGGSDGVDMAQFKHNKPGNRKLDCDSSCAVIERNRRIALALEIKNPDFSAKLGNPTFTEFLKEFSRKNLPFASGIEKDLNNLVQHAKKSLHQSRSHSFPCMNRDKRRFVHELAEFYGCQTQSYDMEPKNVVATAYRDKCWLPNVSLTQLVTKDQGPKAPPPLSGLKSQGVTFTKLEKKKPTLSTETTPAVSRAWETVSTSKPSSTTVDYFDFTG